MFSGEFIPSPCINNCVMDAQTNLCKGCYRTIEEIVSWGIVSSEKKQEILEKVKRRRDAEQK